MEVTITNAGDKGLLIAESLEEWFGQYSIEVTDIVTQSCWLAIQENGPCRIDELFPHGQVSFNVEQNSDYLIGLLTTLFEGSGLSFHIPDIFGNNHFLVG